MLDYLSILRSEVRPALGCTEPIAVAYAAAKARQVLGCAPDRIEVGVSGNVLKNGMGVGIPGSKDVGIETAAALGVFGGNADAVLEVLAGMTPEQAREAREFVAGGGVAVSVERTPQRLYIRVRCRAGEESGEVTIAGTHTNIVSILRNGETQYDAPAAPEQQESGSEGMTVAGIYDFITSVPARELEFLQLGIDMNEAMAREGLTHEYGLCVGQSIWESSQSEEGAPDMDASAVSWAAAGADARMAGCSLPVMTTAGSGNHGLTATLPVTTVGRCLGAGHSERLVGQAVRGRREDVVICTKFGILCNERAKKTTGLIETAADVRASCEDSLRRLQTDYIDILLFHVSDFPLEKAPMVLECMETLAGEGKLRGYGWSTPDPPRAALFARGDHCVGFEFPENVLEDDAAMVALCADAGLSAICRTPLAMGLLTGKYNGETQFKPGDLRGKGGAPWMTYYHDGKPDEEMLRRLAAIREILTAGGRTLAQGCLCWVLGRGAHTIPIPGFRSEKQVRENVAALEYGPLTGAQMEEIETILRG